MPDDFYAITNTTPLLWQGQQRSLSQDRLPYYRQDAPQQALPHKDVSGNDAHAQFCALTGCPPSNLKAKDKFQVPKKSLYGRTVSQLSSQNRAYNFSASLNNLMLLTQVIIGAALTALGASASSHILITIFGATNTIIAGLVAYLKSRGQPMRARMYRDDLERIVDEIENSEVMWRGISEGVHGYDEIDTDEVTVRSEVARLTRLYDRAIRLNGMNNPDMYMAGAGGFDGTSGGGVRPSRAAAGTPAVPNSTLAAVASTAPQPSGENAGPAVPVVQNPEDAAPATKAKVDEKPADKPKAEKIEEGKSDGKKVSMDGASDMPASIGASSSKPASDASRAPTPSPTSTPSVQSDQPPQSLPQVPQLVHDPDASPATAPRLKPKRTKSDKSKVEPGDARKVSGDDEEQ